jgi:alkylated DNA repair dioxygenase AlkB
MSRKTETSPPGEFRYQPEILSAQEEQELVERFGGLPLKQFEFRGILARRRVISYGWQYSFAERRLSPVDPIPDFLQEARERAASFSGLPVENLVMTQVIEYSPGSAIGWHRDRAVFGDIIGISLLSACNFRFRRKSGSGWDRYSFQAEPRSIYLLRGPAREEWEHSIPAVQELRYSLVFRSLR